MPLRDAKRVMQVVAEKLDASAKLIWGARIDPSLDKSVRVMLIVTGLPEKRRAAAREERKLRVEAPAFATPQPQEQSPGGNGVEQNPGAIIQLVESLTLEAQPSNEEAPQLDASQILERASGSASKPSEPAEIKAETPSVSEETPAPSPGVDEAPAPKRKRKAKSSKSGEGAPAVEADHHQVAETVQSTATLIRDGQAALAVSASHESEIQAPSASQSKVADKVKEVALPQAKTEEQAASIYEATPQHNLSYETPAEAKPKVPPASRSEAAGKINAGAPPQLKPKTPLPNVNQAARPVNANRGVPQGIRPQTPPANRSQIGREVKAPHAVPPNKPRPPMPGREEIHRVANANPGAPQAVRPKAPIVNRQEMGRASNGQPLQPQRPRPPVQNVPPSNNANLGSRSPSEGRPLESKPSESRPQPVVNKTAGSTANSNKLFEEKSLANLQTIRESIGHLFIDPTRQETLRCMKSAAAAISNQAQRFVFNEIADYAATLEEICTRVLDGEISMNKKILNAFTEMPGIFEGMIQGDADAKAEAKRHRERLKRLADSLVEGEVFQATREAPRNPRPAMGASAFSKPTGGQRPAPASSPTNKAAQQNFRPKPATDVMEYLDDLFSNSKPSPGR
jgi:hypothetical protein